VKWEQEMAMDAELIILSSKHGKGSNINVKVKQPEFKRYDLEDTITETGDIVIRYANNNFPLDPRIALCVHVSARD
jgi:rRNA-processing protein FCF1